MLLDLFHLSVFAPLLSFDSLVFIPFGFSFVAFAFILLRRFLSRV